MYSLPFEASRLTPLASAVTNPATAMGGTVLAIADEDAAERLRPTPRSERSSTRTEPKSVAMPRMCTRLTTG